MASGKSILSAHGDKLFFGFSVLALLASGAAAFLGGSSGETDVTSALGGKPYAPKGVEDLRKEFDDLGKPLAFAQTNMVQLISQIRVACTNDGTLIAWDAKSCWKCGSPQKEKGAKTDSDSDKVYDVVEIANGMDPNRDDTLEDLDKDGFANREELDAGTKPNDPLSHPPLLTKLRVRSIQDKPLKFTLREITKAGTSIILQVSIAGVDKISKVGEVVNGWTLKAYDEPTKTLEITRGGESFKLPRGTVVEKNRRVAELMSLVDDKFKAPALSPGVTIRLFEADYQVTEIQEAGVMLKGPAAEKIRVSLVTPQEIQIQKNMKADGGSEPNPGGASGFDSDITVPGKP
jgi:hypothetical protein